MVQWREVVYDLHCNRRRHRITTTGNIKEIEMIQTCWNSIKEVIQDDGFSSTPYVRFESFMTPLSPADDYHFPIAQKVFYDY